MQEVASARRLEQLGTQASRLAPISGDVPEVVQDAEFEVDVKDNFIPAASVGVMYRPMPVVEIGAQYQMRRKINFTGHGSAVLGTNLGLGADNPDFIAPENEFPHPDCQGTGTITNDDALPEQIEQGAFVSPGVQPAG